MAIRQSLPLTEEAWNALQELAVETGSIFDGRPSWRVLLRRIANGEIGLSVKSRSSSGVSVKTKPSDWSRDVVIRAVGLESEPVTKPLVAKVPETLPVHEKGMAKMETQMRESSLAPVVSRLHNRSGAAPIGRPHDKAKG